MRKAGSGVVAMQENGVITAESAEDAENGFLVEQTRSTRRR
jgi:hypothetical protein